MTDFIGTILYIDSNGENRWSLADSDEYITRKEALAILHIDSSTLNRWGHKKYLVGYKSGHQRLMYKKSEVIARSKGQEL